jgi:hypothetical protein
MSKSSEKLSEIFLDTVLNDFVKIFFQKSIQDRLFECLEFISAQTVERCSKIPILNFRPKTRFIMRKREKPAENEFKTWFMKVWTIKTKTRQKLP